MADMFKLSGTAKLTNSSISPCLLPYLPMTTVTCLDDLRVLAKRQLPRMFYDYIDAGSWTGSTYRANAADLDALRLQQRVGADVSTRNVQSSMLGRAVSMPVALAPVGLTGMQWANGEILAARAAQRFGVPFVLSTMSICSIEEVAAHVGSDLWFQLYLMRDRSFVADLIERASAAGCGALVLTMDLPVPGQRHKDVANGLSVPPRLGLSQLYQVVTRPRWMWRMMRTRRRSFGNIVGHAKDVKDLSAVWSWTASQFEPRLTWDDVAWVKKRWRGKLVVKGIMHPDDARHAIESGADAVVVSNHGGRQLDGAQSSISALPAIVAAVGSRAEVHMDGGIRSGQDILRALGLGARAVYIGRAYQYGLAAQGEAGVMRCLELLRNELDLTMALCGVRDVTEVGYDILAVPPRHQA
jgi:L-lactate dehydrogenase (cytochrome)